MCSLLGEISFSWPIVDWCWAVRAFLAHYALGFFVGLLIMALTLTMLRFLPVTRTEESRIRHYSFWLAVSLSIVSHVSQDYLVGAF